MGGFESVKYYQSEGKLGTTARGRSDFALGSMARDYHPQLWVVARVELHTADRDNVEPLAWLWLDRRIKEGEVYLGIGQRSIHVNVAHLAQVLTNGAILWHVIRASVSSTTNAFGVVR